VLLVAVSGCASKGVDPTDVRPVKEEVASEGYLIGPGDRLNIFVWRNEDISISVPVRPDGRISTPLVEEMMAAGKTPNQLARDIEKVLSKYIKMPVVTVIVTDFVGTFGEQIRVVGQAAQPRALPFRDNISLLDVMIEVGGLTEFAAGNRAKIIRRINGVTSEITVRLEDLLEGGDISANTRMRPGDVLIIPEAWF
jgi:polysaccharide export outer membrane protein